MSRMFYCPNCGKSDSDFQFDERIQRNQITYKNPRDGYGRHITHIICPQCKYELSGFINTTGMYNIKDIHDKEECFEYIKYTIQGYSNNSYCDSNKLLELIREDIKKKSL